MIPKLSETAIPSVFPGCPKYLSKPETKKRRILKKVESVSLSPKKRKQEIAACDSESVEWISG